MLIYIAQLRINSSTALARNANTRQTNSYPVETGQAEQLYCADCPGVSSRQLDYQRRRHARAVDTLMPKHISRLLQCQWRQKSGSSAN